MFKYVAAVGLMTDSEHRVWLKMVKDVGKGRLIPPASCDSDLPQGAVGALSEEVDALCIELMSEVLAESHLRISSQPAADGGRHG